MILLVSVGKLSPPLLDGEDSGGESRAVELEHWVLVGYYTSDNTRGVRFVSA